MRPTADRCRPRRSECTYHGDQLRLVGDEALEVVHVQGHVVLNLSEFEHTSRALCQKLEKDKESPTVRVRQRNTTA